MKKLTEKALCKAALEFCKQESGHYCNELFAVTDGKAMGTFVEHRFANYLAKYYALQRGSSANGLDLPTLNCDIKVTSIIQPQYSCPYRNSRQKVYGLGYNLMLFVYKKEDDIKKKQGALFFVSCSFIQASRTADYQLTKGLKEILSNNGNVEDIFAFLNDRQVPGDEITLRQLAEEIIQNTPIQGYLTISNALQWRLQYSRIVNLTDSVSGIVPIIKYEG